MKFKGYKVGERYLSKHQLNFIKENNKTTPDLLVACNNADEYYIETISGHDINLICERDLFNFPVYQLSMEQLNTDRTKYMENGEIVDFTKEFLNKTNRNSIIKKLNILSDAHANIGQNIQNVATPKSIVQSVCSQFEQEYNNFTSSEFWVFFNLEFLEELIYERNVNKKRIKFFTDNIIKAKWAFKIYNVDMYVINNEEFLKQTGNNMPKANKIVVIGNPPYHEKGKGNTDDSNCSRNNPLYNKYITTIWNIIKPSYFSFIIPARWFVQTGMGMETFRKFMLSGHLDSINHFANTQEIFPKISLPGGVCYFLLSQNYSETYTLNGNIKNINESDIIISSVIDNNIANKILARSPNTIADIHFSNIPFNITTNHEKTETGIPCLFSSKHYNDTSTVLYVSEKDVTKNKQAVNKYKVVHKTAPSKLNGNTNFDEPLEYFGDSDIVILDPGVVCSASFGVMYCFDSKEEATNFKKYTHTKFFRYFMGLRVSNYVLTTPCFVSVPDQEDYSHPYDDEYLYEKYKLTEDEISHIEMRILN